MSDHAGKTKVQPGFTPERLGFFTDAVFAIAMTLLVIEIERPTGEEMDATELLAKFLLAHIWSFGAYALVFILVWSIWRRHHTFIDGLERLSRPTVTWHAPMLMFVAFLPFPTALLGNGIDNPLAVTLMSGTLAAIYASEAMIKESAYGSSIVEDDVDPETLRRSACASWAVAAFFVLTAALTWVFVYAPIGWMFAALAATWGGKLLYRIRGGSTVRSR